MSKSLPYKPAKPKNDVKTSHYIDFHKKIPLTPKEQIVFYGLVKFPELNDKNLSRKLKIKRPTVTAIRNKLKRQNFYSPHVIPDFKLLGYELMTFIWGKTNMLAQLEEKMEIPAIKKTMQAPETIFQIATDNEFFAFLIFKNFTEFKKMEEEWVRVYEKYPPKEHDVKIVHFPFEISEIRSLFDYSSLLKKLFKLEFEEEKKAQKPKTSKPNPLIELKEREKTILSALVKYPQLNDTEITKKINITRQTFSKIKSKLIKRGAIKLVNEPNFKKIDCELFVNIHSTFNPQIDSNKRRSLLEKSKNKCPMVFDVESNTEEICASLFEDYLSFKIAQDKLEKEHKENDLLLKDPTIQIIPIQQIKFHKTNFISITEKTLNIKIP